MTGKELQNVILLEIIAPSVEEEDNLPQEIRFEIRRRFDRDESWEKVFEPILNKDIRDKYISLFNSLENTEEDN